MNIKLKLEKRVSIQLNEELYQKIEKRAMLEHRSISNMIAVLLETALAMSDPLPTTPISHPTPTPRGTQT